MRTVDDDELGSLAREILNVLKRHRESCSDRGLADERIIAALGKALVLELSDMYAREHGERPSLSHMIISIARLPKLLMSEAALLRSFELRRPGITDEQLIELINMQAAARGAPSS